MYIHPTINFKDNSHCIYIVCCTGIVTGYFSFYLYNCVYNSVVERGVHTAGLLFALEGKPSIDELEDMPCTSKPCQLNQPSKKK